MKSDLKHIAPKFYLSVKTELAYIPYHAQIIYPLLSLQNETKYGKDHYYSSKKNNYPTHIWKDLNKRKTISL